MTVSLRTAAMGSLVAAALTLSACSTPAPEATTAATAAPDAPLASVVPEEHRGETLRVVAGDANPPMYSRDANGEIAGITIDLAEAAAEVLGLTLDVEANSFDATIPGLQTGAYDLSTWATDLTAEREAVIDQIPFGDIGYGFLLPEESAPLADDLSSLCGLTVAAIKGQTTVPVLEEASADCDVPISVSTFPDQAAATLAVKSGRADVATVNSVSGLHIAEQDDELQFSEPLFNLHLTGIAAPKDSWVGTAFAAALQHLVDDGTYADILATYGAESLTIDVITVNPELP